MIDPQPPISRADLIDVVAQIIHLEGNPPKQVLRLSYLNMARAQSIAERIVVEAAAPV